jgi:REP element-mobilizing transposase RayT
LREHDYAQPGIYFVTVCTAHRDCLFGHIHDDEVVLSTAGQVIESWWESITLQFPAVALDAKVVMPNHLHGAIMIEREEPVTNLSDVIKWFKGKRTNDYIRGVKMDGWPRLRRKLWQPGFYEHIVRSEAALNRVRTTISGNPSRWPWDEEHQNCTGKGLAYGSRAQGPGLPGGASRT